MSPSQNQDVSFPNAQSEEPGGQEHSPLFQKWITAAVAIGGFLLFVAAVLAFRSLSRLDARDLGISMWVEQPVTESRLTPVVDSLLKQSGLAAAMATAIDPAWLKSADDPPKIWDAMNDAAETLVADESKARLARMWADALQGDDSRTRVLQQLRDYRMSPGPSTPAIDAIATEYEKALTVAKSAWIASELPTPAIEGFLLKNGLTPQPVVPDARKRVSARTADETLGQLATRVRTALADPIPSQAANESRPAIGDEPQRAAREAVRNGLRGELKRAIGAELDLSSAQAPVVKAVDQDFTSRWMWVLAAAIFLTTAASAIAGSGWRTWKLTASGSRLWPVAGYVVAVIAGLVFGLMMRGRIPDFLSRPGNRFALVYDLHFEHTTLLMNTVTAMAVSTLFVASWASFLVTSRNDRHDDHLEARLATLRWSFHTATFVLAAGVLHLYAFLQWPSAFMSDAPAALVQSGARVAALALGAVFSTLLLLIYLPASSVLVGEVRARRKAAAGDEARVTHLDGMLEDNGFTGPPTQQVLRFVQLFAPLLIAPLGEQIANFLGQ